MNYIDIKQHNMSEIVKEKVIEVCVGLKYVHNIMHSAENETTALEAQLEKIDLLIFRIKLSMFYERNSFLNY